MNNISQLFETLVKKKVVLARIRLGHTIVHNVWVVMLYLLYVEEILFFYVNNMQQLFQDIHIDSIMTSLKGIKVVMGVTMAPFF